MTSLIKPRYLLVPLFLIAVSILFPSRTALASEWQQIGYGTLNSTRFDVYVDSSSILRVGNQVRFWQGHVFYADKRLPSGTGYIRVSLEREGDCQEKTTKTLRAIFYSRDGSVVHNYSGDSAGEKPSSPDTINTKALEFACAYKKSNREGISR